MLRDPGWTLENSGGEGRDPGRDPTRLPGEAVLLMCTQPGGQTGGKLWLSRGGDPAFLLAAGVC